MGPLVHCLGNWGNFWGKLLIGELPGFVDVILRLNDRTGEDVGGDLDGPTGDSEGMPLSGGQFLFLYVYVYVHVCAGDQRGQKGSWSYREP